MKVMKQDAIASLVPNAPAYHTDKHDNIIAWDVSDNPKGIPQPSQADIDAEFVRLQAEYDAQEYARKRKAEYPSIEELVVALYDIDDKAAIDAKRAEIKLKYPKPGA